MKKIIIIITALIEFATLQGWFVCQRFTDIFHFKSIDVAVQLSTYINSFKGKPMWMGRLFHNKLIQDPLNFLRVYLQFWDVRFGINWFSLVGYFGIFAGLYYIISNKKKTRYHWLALILLAVLPCIEILFAPQLPLQVKSVYLWLPFAVFSLYGINQFLSHGNIKKRVVIIILLLAISLLWIFFLPYNFSNYCIHYLPHIHVRKP
jgi:hypothetical protein